MDLKYEIKVKPKSLIKQKFICKTDEYATKHLKSDWRSKIILEKIQNSKNTQNSKRFENLKLKFKMYKTKIIPPFNISLAKIILANMGASTWTLGSHMWKPKVGILTIPTKIKISKNSKLKLKLKFKNLKLKLKLKM